MASHDLFRPLISLRPDLHSPSHETISQALPTEEFADLYTNIRDEGLTHFPRIDSRGNVELYLVFESIDDFSSATHGEVYLEFKSYQDKLLAIIWTLDDPLNPLGFPMSFNIQEKQDRYMALRLLDQPQTWVHYVAFVDQEILHIYSEAISFPTEEKSRVESLVHDLYEEKADTDEEASRKRHEEMEIKELPTETITAHTLPEESLLESGTAYVFDYQRLIAAHGPQEAQVVLMQAVHQALLIMRRHYRSEVRETTFTVWAAERGPLLYLFVTPSLEHLFEVVHYSEEEANPFSKTLLAIPQFVETMEGAPLALGAYPIMRYVQGKWMHVELDEAFQTTLHELFAQHYSGEDNPFEMNFLT
ncbi:hypothetical protein ACQCN2_07450 [Brevibacillus ginsengisoli]|uniref:hypothetical protein n=1 Tax=Brevibacillus ginsengisoli TaxID=363854 RepID=UPI003CF25156